jgi:hypothetical protein
MHAVTRLEFGITALRYMIGLFQPTPFALGVLADRLQLSSSSDLIRQNDDIGKKIDVGASIGLRMRVLVELPDACRGVEEYWRSDHLTIAEHLSRHRRMLSVGFTRTLS